MEYLLLIATDETAAPTPGSDGFDDLMAGWNAYTPADRGRPLDRRRRPAADRDRDDGPQAPRRRSERVDGPFAETKEQLGGFYLVRPPTWTRRWRWPRAARSRPARVEVRPMAFRPDAGVS